MKLMRGIVKRRKTRPSDHLSNTEITRRLRSIARRSLPLYQRIVRDPVFARRLTALIRARRYTLVRGMIRSVTPSVRVSVQGGLISYNFQLFNNFRNPASRVGIALSIDRYNVRRLQRVCRDVLIPVLRRMITDPAFARRFVINRAGDENENLRLIQSIVGRQNVRIFGFDMTSAFFGISGVYIAEFILDTTHLPSGTKKRR